MTRSVNQSFSEKLIAYQLSQLGFYFVGNHNCLGKLRCSFCCCTIYMFTKDGLPYIQNNIDRILITLLQHHLHMSATCPFSLKLNGDDTRFTDNDIMRAIESSIGLHFEQLAEIDLGSQHHIDSAYLRLIATSIISQFPYARPLLDGEMSNAYNNVISELDYELFFQFETNLNIEAEWSGLDDLTPPASLIDYLIGVPPKHITFNTLMSRIDSFKNDVWHNHQISQTNSYLLKPESFAKAGFYYSGAENSVICFWCGLDLNNWKDTDDSVNKHIRSHQVAHGCSEA